MYRKFYDWEFIPPHESKRPWWCVVVVTIMVIVGAAFWSEMWR